MDMCRDNRARERLNLHFESETEKMATAVRKRVKMTQQNVFRNS